MTREAKTEHPVHFLIANRWSPYAYSDRSVSNEELCSLLEAARWAPSSYNEQPWSYLVARKDQPEEFEKILSCLVDANQKWAENASILMICCTNRKFSRNGKPNAAAEHDLGLAAANLSLEATSRGIAVHQMIGIEPDKARELFSIPDDTDALTAIAIGYAADPDTLSGELKERETSPRERKSLSDFVFTGKWGNKSAVIED